MKFQNMIEDSHTLIEMIHGIVLTVGPDGKIVTFNSYLQQISGYTFDEIKAVNWFDLFVSADPGESCREYFQNVILKTDVYRYVNKIKNRDGNMLFFEWNLKAVKDATGNVIRVLGVGQDITERIDNEGQLLAERFELIERNRELTCLYGISQVVESSLASFNEKLEAIVALIPRAFRYSETASARISFDGQSFCTPGFKKTGARLSQPINLGGARRGIVEVVYSGKGAPCRDPALLFLAEEKRLLEAVARQLALIFEKNEADAIRKDLEAQIRHADRLATIGQLAAGIAHELNNPLGDILGFAQLAAKHPDMPDSVLADIKRIVKCCLYAREIIKKVLLFSHQMPPRKTHVNLNDLIEEWMDVIDVHCQKKGIKIHLALERKLPEITGDPFQLNQVLVNLVNNAIDSMTAGGLLTITTRAQKGRVYLEVRDTGIGMTGETLKQIFTPFFTTKDVDRGTGLGLSVVYGIAETHGGSIKADSREGEGSVFEVTLPATHPMRGNDHG
jgi:PAS domain S-box-containing protein